MNLTAIIIISVLAASNIAFLVLFVHSRWAYHKLMQKNLCREEKEEVLVEIVKFDTDSVRDAQERQMLERLRVLLEEDKVYLDSALSIQDMAKRLATNRTTLSHVINTHLNQNFASLLNSYRIKEAVRLLSDPQYFQEKIEVVGELCGFTPLSRRRWVSRPATSVTSTNGRTPRSIPKKKERVSLSYT